MLIGKILRIVLGKSRVTALGMSLQLEDCRAGVSEGWSFISGSRMARFLPAFKFFGVFLPVLILFDLLQQEERLNINRKKEDSFYSCVSLF